MERRTRFWTRDLPWPCGPAGKPWRHEPLLDKQVASNALLLGRKLSWTGYARNRWGELNLSQIGPAFHFSALCEIQILACRVLIHKRSSLFLQSRQRRMGDKFCTWGNWKKSTLPESRRFRIHSRISIKTDRMFLLFKTKHWSSTLPTDPPPFYERIFGKNSKKVTHSNLSVGHVQNQNRRYVSCDSMEFEKIWFLASSSASHCRHPKVWFEWWQSALWPWASQGLDRDIQLDRMSGSLHRWAMVNWMRPIVYSIFLWISLSHGQLSFNDICACSLETGTICATTIPMSYSKLVQQHFDACQTPELSRQWTHQPNCQTFIDQCLTPPASTTKCSSSSSQTLQLWHITWAHPIVTRAIWKLLQECCFTKTLARDP